MKSTQTNKQKTREKNKQIIRLPIFVESLNIKYIMIKSDAQKQQQKQRIESFVKSNKIVVIERNENLLPPKSSKTATPKRARSSSARVTVSDDGDEENGRDLFRAKSNEIDLMHLFELYGIDLDKVSRVSIDKISSHDVDSCEKFILEHYLDGNMPLKVSFH